MCSSSCGQARSPRSPHSGSPARGELERRAGPDVQHAACHKDASPVAVLHVMRKVFDELVVNALRCQKKRLQEQLAQAQASNEATRVSQTEDDQRESWGSGHDSHSPDRDLRPEDDDEVVVDGYSPRDLSTNTARPALVLSRRRYRPASGSAPETASHNHDVRILIPADILARSAIFSASGEAVGVQWRMLHASCMCPCCWMAHDSTCLRSSSPLVLQSLYHIYGATANEQGSDSSNT